MSYLDYEYYGNHVRAWLVALAVLAGLFALLVVARRIAIGRLAAFAERTQTDIDDLAVELIRRTRFFFLFAVSLSAASLALAVPDGVRQSVRVLAVSALLLQAALWGNSAITFWMHRYIGRKATTHPGTVTAVTALGFVIRGMVWSLVLLLALDNFGVNITALVAGLGVTGIAVALAVQSLLSDLLGALSIVLGKPFVLGDFIQVGEHSGTVTFVGLRSTRVSSLSGEEIIIPNKHLLENRVRNFARLTERRIAFTLGVSHETGAERAAAIPRALREIVEGRENVRFDRSHLRGFGESSLDFETVYFVTTPDYNTYMDIQQAINLEILRRFEREGISLAVPTRRTVTASPPVTGHTPPPPTDGADGAVGAVGADGADGSREVRASSTAAGAAGAAAAESS